MIALVSAPFGSFNAEIASKIIALYLPSQVIQSNIMALLKLLQV
jgi:hypothetical protein